MSITIMMRGEPQCRTLRCVSNEEISNLNFTYRWATTCKTQEDQDLKIYIHTERKRIQTQH